MNTQRYSFMLKVLLLLVLTMAILGVSGIAYAGGRAEATRPGANAEPATANGNQLKAATDASAEARKAKGLGRTTTPDDRRAAARRTAERKARHMKNLKAKGGATP